MKYWLFDGDDVIGPFAPHELAAREDFSATSLICAEGSSEDSAGWQVASSFDSFHFNSVTGRLENAFLPEKAPADACATLTQETTPTPEKPAMPTSVVAPEKPVQPAPVGTAATAALVKTKRPKKQEPAFVRLTKVKTPATPPIPVALARENADLDLVLPPQSVHTKPVPEQVTPKEPVESPKEQVSVSSPQTQKQTKKETAPKETTKTLPATAEEKTVPPVEPEIEAISTCTLPLLDEETAATVDLPPLSAAEMKPPQSVPASAPQTVGEKLLEQAFPVAEGILERVPAVSSAEQPKVAPAPAAEQPVQDLVPPPEASAETVCEVPTTSGQSEPALSTQPIYPVDTQYPLPKRPRVKTLSEIKRQFANRPEQEDFILEQQLLARTPAKKSSRAVWIIPLVILGVALLVGIGGVRALARRVPADQKAPAQTAAAQQPPVRSAQEVASSPTARVTSPEKPAVPKPAAPKPVTASDKALSAVQNYQLPGNKGTIASYFDRVYQPNLAQGYVASWSVEPLHKNTYIVKYRLTKTRMEPIVYVFQADAVRGQLTGALNNVALDLVGRI